MTKKVDGITLHGKTYGQEGLEHESETWMTVKFIHGCSPYALFSHYTLIKTKKIKQDNRNKNNLKWYE